MTDAWQSIKITEFDHVVTGPTTSLLRVSGRAGWRQTVGARPSLVIEAGGQERRFEALEAPRGRRGALRAAYPVPFALIRTGASFWLEHEDGARTELPAPDEGIARVLRDMGIREELDLPPAPLTRPVPGGRPPGVAEPRAQRQPSEPAEATRASEPAEADIQLARMVDEQARTRMELAKAQEELTTAREELTAAREQLAETHGERARAQEAIDTAQAELTTAREDLATAHQERARAQEELTTAHEERARAHEELTTAHEERARVQEELAAAQEERARTQEELTRTHDGLVSAREELTRTREELTAARDDLATVRNDLARLREKLTALDGRNTELEQHLQEQAGRISSLEREVAEAAPLREKLERELATLRSAHASLERDLDEARDKLRNAMYERDEQARQAAAFDGVAVKARERATRAEADKQKAADALREFELWRSELKRRLADAATELGTVQAAREADQRELARLRQALAETEFGGARVSHEDD